MPAAVRAGIASAGMFAPLLGSAVVQRMLKAGGRAGPAGPTDAERARGVSHVWGEVTDAAGGRAGGRLRTPRGCTPAAPPPPAVSAPGVWGAPPPAAPTPAPAAGTRPRLARPGAVSR